MLTEQENARGSSTYWAVLKKRLKEEGNELLTICKQLKMKAADGKMRLTDVADMQGIFRIIQSIPSPKQNRLSYGSQRLEKSELMKLLIRKLQ